MTTKTLRPDVAVVVLTRNAGRLWPEWIGAIQQQTVVAGRYLVIDSQSDDATVALAHAAGMEVESIHPVSLIMAVRVNGRWNYALMRSWWCF